MRVTIEVDGESYDFTAGRLNLSSGDVLALSTEAKLRPLVIDYLKDVLESKLPGVTVLVFDGGMQFEHRKGA